MNIARLEAVLRQRYGNRYRRTRGKNGPEFKINCPFCLKNMGKVDRKFKLSMNPQLGVYRCWRCAARGQLSDMFGDMPGADEVVFVPRALPTALDNPGTLWSLGELPEDHVAVRYLRGRGYDPAMLTDTYGIRYCSEGRPFIGGLFNTSNTIIFPIWMDGKLAGWQARLLYNPDSLTDPECKALGFPQDEDGDYRRPPKYFTPSSVDKGNCLFNYDVARQSEIGVVTEGPLDVVSTGPCAVGTFGKGFTPVQARLLKTYWKLLIVLLDPGDANAESRQLYNDIAMSRPTVAVNLADYKDPGEAPTREIWRQIDVQARKGGVQLENYNWGPNWSPAVFKE